jgi:hypothetical protein
VGEEGNEVPSRSNLPTASRLAPLTNFKALSYLRSFAFIGGSKVCAAPQLPASPAGEFLPCSVGFFSA